MQILILGWDESPSEGIFMLKEKLDDDTVWMSEFKRNKIRFLEIPED